MTHTSTEGSGFLGVPDATAEVERLYAADRDDVGYVTNLSRVWAYAPEVHDGLFALLGDVSRLGGLTVRQRGVLVAACASTVGDAYCSLAWGRRLADEVGPEVAAGVLRGDDSALDAGDRALAAWARRVTDDPNGVRSEDVDALRAAAGLDDAGVFAVTAYVALRLAFSTVNDALGARPDRALAEAAPEPVRQAVAYGRPVAGSAG